jgi:hypothetical protein
LGGGHRILGFGQNLQAAGSGGEWPDPHTPASLPYCGHGTELHAEKPVTADLKENGRPGCRP